MAPDCVITSYSIHYTKLYERDLLGIAQTGTGKTAAFSLPSLHRLAQKPTGRK